MFTTQELLKGWVEETQEFLDKKPKSEYILYDTDNKGFNAMVLGLNISNISEDNIHFCNEMIDSNMTKNIVLQITSNNVNKIDIEDKTTGLTKLVIVRI